MTTGVAHPAVRSVPDEGDGDRSAPPDTPGPAADRPTDQHRGSD